MKKTILAIILAGASSLGVAHAGDVLPGQILGDGASASTDITFDSSVNITNTLAAVPTLKAGNFKNGDALANGTLTDNDGASRVFDVKFGPEVPDAAINDGGAFLTGTVSGKNDSNNKLKVELTGKTATGSSSTSSIILNSDTPATTASYTIESSVDQTVAADTYTVSTVAYAWVQ